MSDNNKDKYGFAKYNRCKHCKYRKLSPKNMCGECVEYDTGGLTINIGFLNFTYHFYHKNFVKEVI